MKQKALICLLLLLLAALLGCNEEPEDKGPRFGEQPPSADAPVYRLAVHPLHNPATLVQAYQPLVDFLNGKLRGARLTLEASRDYANFEEKYQARKPAFLLPNPWQTLQAMRVGYQVIAMAGEPTDLALNQRS
jgi:phosphonate transport system substrate-binding protein